MSGSWRAGAGAFLESLSEIRSVRAANFCGWQASIRSWEVHTQYQILPTYLIYFYRQQI